MVRLFRHGPMRPSRAESVSRGRANARCVCRTGTLARPSPTDSTSRVALALGRVKFKTVRCLTASGSPKTDSLTTRFHRVPRRVLWAGHVGLTTDTFGALTNAGITNVAVIPNTATSATFTTGVPTPLAATSNLLGLSTTAQQNLGLEPLGTAIAGKYVLLGVGQATTMIGKTMTAAPVHFPDTGAVNPNAVYQRFLAIFQITNSAGVALDRAKFVGFIASEGSSLGDELRDYYRVTASN